LIFSLLFAGALIGCAHATSYVSRTWEQIAEKSEFIGVVECITGGGIVARYKVVDSWKGIAEKAEFHLRQGVDYWEPQFPIALCGERFLVFAAKNVTFEVMSLSGGGSVPLWWRQIPAELRAAAVVPMRDFTPRSLFLYLKCRAPTLEDFRSEVLAFLGEPEDKREHWIMLSIARDRLDLPNPYEPSNKGKPEHIALYEDLSKTEGVREMLDRVLALARSGNVPERPKTAEERAAERLKSVLWQVICDGGGKETDAVMSKLEPSGFPWGTDRLKEALSRVRWGLAGKPDGSQEAPEQAAAPPNAKHIADAKAQLYGQPWDYRSDEAFELLLKHAPDIVASFLLEWVPAGNQDRDNQFGYVLGSVFGHFCPTDRATHLSKLCSAKDAWVRAAAAVYLCFDDPKAGQDNLRKCLSIEGDPGAWAAIALASRGDKKAMERALEVLAKPMDGGMASVNHGNLQKRLSVLLSNSADKSGLSQPPSPPSKHFSGRDERAAIQTQYHMDMVAWWKANRDNIELHDPWLPTLEKQKID